jgi:hypothetical protein
MEDMTKMQTTELFMEHLLNGLQASIWITLLIFSYFGYEWFNLFSLKISEAMALLLLVSIVYPLGVFIDEIADSISKNYQESPYRGNLTFNMLTYSKCTFYLSFNRFISRSILFKMFNI